MGFSTDVANDRALDDGAFMEKYGPFIQTTRLYYRLHPFTRVLDSVFNAFENHVLRAGRGRIGAPIFLLGNFRSGTSFLESVIALHPDIGYFTYASQIFPRSPIVLNALLQWFPAIDQPMTPMHMPASKVTANSPFEGEPLWRFCRNHCWTAEPLNVLGDSFDDPAFETTLRRTIVKHLVSQQKRRFINKNPWNTYRLGYLNRLFPDARYIYIVRHPHRMLRSQLDLEDMGRRALAGLPRFNSVFSDQFGPPRVFFRTARHTEIVEAYKRDRALGTAISLVDCDDIFRQSAAGAGLAPRLVQIRYEDLVSDFSAQMKRIFRSLDLDCGEDLIERASSTLRRDLRSAQASVPRFTPAVEATLAPMMERYAYDIPQT